MDRKSRPIREEFEPVWEEEDSAAGYSGDIFLYDILWDALRQL